MPAAGGYPGVNQINVTVPSGISFGCYVSVAIVVNGTNVSNIPSLPMEQNGGECSDSIFGTSGGQISTISEQGTVNYGDLLVVQSTMPATTGSGTTTTTAAVGIFEQITGADAVSSSSVSLGSCSLNQTVVITGPPPTITGINPGTITMTGPAGQVTLTSIPQVPYLYQYGETGPDASTDSRVWGIVRVQRIRRPRQRRADRRPVLECDSEFRRPAVPVD